jgi:hypothetical protein
VATAPPSVNMFAATTPSMNTDRADATATLLPNGKVLIAGGTESSGPALNSTDLYDPVSNTFAPAASTPVMNTARTGATATLLPNGKVLIAGGYGSLYSLKSTELYDPVTNKFATSPPMMNTARGTATATLLPNGKVLIAGGIDNAGNVLNSTELYDPVSNSFAASTPVMNTARAGATAALLPDGKVLVAGGFSGSGGVLSSTELYDSVTNTFAAPDSTPAMNIARDGTTATLLPNGKVLLAGGDNNMSRIPFSSTELYDSVTNTFALPASTPIMNNPRTGATATLLPNGKVLLAGGLDVVGFNQDASTSTTELYDAATNSFAASAATPVMNSPRAGCTATLLPNGKALIAGGEYIFEPSINLSSTELYTP